MRHRRTKSPREKDRRARTPPRRDRGIQDAHDHPSVLAEFPPLLYGIIVGTHDGKLLREVVKAMPGELYEHNGAASYDLDEQSMAFALNAVPHRVSPTNAMRRLEELARRTKECSRTTP